MQKREKPLPPDLDARLQQAKRILEADSRVVFAYLFGGLGRGKPRPLSDIDISVYLNNNADILTTKLDLVGLLTQVLNTDEVDIVILNNAPLSLAGRIQHCAQILVDKIPSQRFAYESLTRRQFADFAIRERTILFRRFEVDR
jgi:predicted nucleotidyltransferase